MSDSRKKDGAQVMAALDDLVPLEADLDFDDPTQMVFWKQRKVDSVSRRPIADTTVYWVALKTDLDGQFTGCSDKSWNDAVANAQGRFAEAKTMKTKGVAR